MRSFKLSWVFALFASIAATSAFAAQPSRTVPRPIIDDRPTPPAVMRTIPTPFATASAAANPSTRRFNPIPVNSQYIGAVADGTKVPLVRLPRLPVKSPMNTATPKHHTLLRPMAATGATIDFSGTALQNSCILAGSIGDQFNTGCVLQWNSINLSPAGHTYQDYEIAQNNGNELLASATAVGGSYSGTGGGLHNTTLSSAGTYIFGVYDVTASTWVAVVYVNAGQVFTVKVYQDAFHTQEEYQFSASSSSDAFIYLQNVSQSDYLVVGVSQTAVNPNCVFIAPAPLPSPYSYPANQLCQLTASTGVQAPGGNLAITWPLNSSYTAGTYSVEVYDLTAGQRLGQVQVAITSASGIALNMYPDGTCGNCNPGPSPFPAPVQTPSTLLAWDGSNWNGSVGQDESVTGVKTTVTGLTNGSNYLWSLIDPQGQVVGTAAGTIAGTSGTNVFTFDSLSGGASNGGPGTQVLPPGSYPAKSWVVQLYDTTHKIVDASQSFQMLGYSTQTQFNQSGTLGTALTVPTGATGVTVSLRLTNNSSTIWNGFGDNLTSLEFSTSQNSFDLSAGTGAGINTALNGQACGQTVCTETVTDSVGNSWTASNLCTATGGTSFCDITLTPVAASTYLAPGAYIDITNVKFTQSTGSSCKPCQSSTSELPQHGIYWSAVGNSPAAAYNPVFFNKSSVSESATAWFRMFGSSNNNTRTLFPGTAPTPAATPSYLVGNHFYTNTDAQSDYVDTSPYAVTVGLNLASSHDDIQGFTLNNTGSDAIFEVAVGLPSIFSSQGFAQVDNNLTGSTWAYTPCPTGFSSNWLCFLASGSNAAGIGVGQTQTIFQDSTMTSASFAFTDINIQTQATHGSSNIWSTATAVAGTTTTADGRNTLDNLAFGTFSLIGGDMTGAFNPSTIGTGGTSTLGWQFTNTSTSVDINPDSVDALVLEAPNNTVTLNNTPTMTTAGWSYQGLFSLTGSSRNQYWFGTTCGTWKTTLAQQGASYGGPPSATGSPVSTPLTAPYPSASCSPGTDTNAAPPNGNVIATNMQFTNIGAAGTQTWHMYAHGANGGGWSAAIPVTLSVTSEAASVWFNSINGGAALTSWPAIIAGGPNTYQYAIKNTSSGTQKIGTFVVTIPGLDINNQNAFDGTQAWAVTNITTGGVTLSNPAGQADGTGGCSVSTVPANTFNPTNGGANGQITVSGCTTFNPGDIIYVNFAAANPSSQNDTYVWPSVIDPATANVTAGVSSLGSDEITEEFSLGLNIVVDPLSPGPGGSTPVIICGGTCTFSGATVDFGNIPNSTAFTYADVVRTSVVYTGATAGGHTLDLYVEASQNPACTGGTCASTNELLTLVDNANSTQGAGISFLQTTYAVVPTTGGASGYGMHIAQVPETKRATPYDIIDSYKVSVGTEAISSTIVTLTYTVVPN